jgi:hypothetical protein
VADQKSPWERRADVFRNSYTEVLLFLKHQDDKIGRLLTALAFLTAAGVSLFLFTERREAGALQLDTPAVDAGDFFFATFIVSLLFALLAVLAALDPTSQTPNFLPRQPARRTILYYGSIYRKAGWPEPDAEPEELDELLARSFHDDAEELARRAEHKVRRFADGRAFVHVSLVSLVLLGIARIEGLGESSRWWLVASLLATIGFLPAWDIYWHRHFGFADVRATLPELIRRTVVFLVPAGVAAALLASAMFAPGVRPRLLSVSYALFSLLYSRFALRYLGTKVEMAAGACTVGAIGVGLLFLIWCA